MGGTNGRVGRAAGFLHHNLLWLILGAYVLAGTVPGAGLWFRSADLGAVGGGDLRVHVSPPAVLLAVLLFNAGLGVDPRRLRGLFGRSGALVGGLLANLAVPLVFILGVSVTLSLWHNSAEVQAILVGLALVASMPVAGSSTGWAQSAGGDMALSLGLVLGSTLLSPLTTPAVLHAVGWVAEGAFADCLHQTASGTAGSFLLAFVMVPSLAGIAIRCLAGGDLVGRVRPGLGVANVAALLVLCYSNAAVALPRTFAHPDWDFLAVVLVLVTAMSALGFATGVGVAWWFRADPGRRTALAFGLGMTNNGTGLVLATTALAGMDDVILPVIFYNLVQHLVAAGFLATSRRGATTR